MREDYGEITVDDFPAFTRLVMLTTCVQELTLFSSPELEGVGAYIEQVTDS